MNAQVDALMAMLEQRSVVGLAQRSVVGLAGEEQGGGGCDEEDPILADHGQRIFRITAIKNR